MPTSNYPNGFEQGLTVRGFPLVVAHPGQVFWVSNSTVLQVGQKGGSDGNKGTFFAPFATVAYAITQCTPGRGDIIMVKPGHAENISTATAMNSSVAAVAIVGQGTGDNRPTFTFDTAATSTWNVSAPNCTFQNLLFKANFLSITAAFSLTTAKATNITNCEFRDTTNVLNFLNFVRASSGANTVDGLVFSDNNVFGLGTTNVVSAVTLTNTADRVTMQRNAIVLGVNNNNAIALTVTAGILTNLLFTDNMGYRLNTTTAGGGTINVGGTTSTGIVARNYQQTATTTADLLFTTTVGLAAFENRVTGVVGATGFVIPTADS